MRTQKHTHEYDTKVLFGFFFLCILRSDEARRISAPAGARRKTRASATEGQQPFFDCRSNQRWNVLVRIAAIKDKL